MAERAMETMSPPKEEEYMRTIWKCL